MLASCPGSSRIRSVIILVMKQIGLPLRGRPILLITRMIAYCFVAFSLPSSSSLLKLYNMSLLNLCNGLSETFTGL